MITETYAYMSDPSLTDIFETPDNSYVFKSRTANPTIALISWLADLLAPRSMDSLKLDIEQATNWAQKGSAACKATLRWPSEYPDLPLYLYVEYLTILSDGESIYQVTVQPLDK